MKKITLLIIVWFIALGAGAQSKADIDTFRINSAVFVATTPDGWFSTSVTDGVQQDSTWNYKMRYAPLLNPENTTAEIWIRIVLHPDVNPNEKKLQPIQYNRTITQSSVDNWPCYRIYYTPERIKGCKKCGPRHTLVYSIPLNVKHSLEIVFIGQGSTKQIEPLKTSFQQIAQTFVHVNLNALSQFRILNFQSPMNQDTFWIDGFTMLAPYPENFTRGARPGGWSSVYGAIMSDELNSYCFTSSDGSFSISAKGAVVSKADSTKSELIDTSLNRVPNKDIYGTIHNIIYSTTRQVLTQTEDTITLLFEMKVPNQDPVWMAYYEIMFREYINYFITTNPSINRKESTKLVPLEFKPIDSKYPLRPKQSEGILKPR